MDISVGPSKRRAMGGRREVPDKGDRIEREEETLGLQSKQKPVRCKGSGEGKERELSNFQRKTEVLGFVRRDCAIRASQMATEKSNLRKA